MVRRRWRWISTLCSPRPWTLSTPKRPRSCRVRSLLNVGSKIITQLLSMESLSFHSCLFFCRWSIKTKWSRKVIKLYSIDSQRRLRLSGSKRWRSCRARYGDDTDVSCNTWTVPLNLEGTDSVCECAKPQTKYKEAGKNECSSCLYSLLPHTMETQHAKEAAELLSEVQGLLLLET